MQLLTKHASNKSKALAGKLLNKIGGLSKPRKNFILSAMILFLSMRGRYNFKGMERCGSYSEKSYRLHFEKGFDFFKFNAGLYKLKLSDNCIVHLIRLIFQKVVNTLHIEECFIVVV